jgi:hypothetical protein
MTRVGYRYSSGCAQGYFGFNCRDENRDAGTWERRLTSIVDFAITSMVEKSVSGSTDGPRRLVFEVL